MKGYSFFGLCGIAIRLALANVVLGSCVSVLATPAVPDLDLETAVSGPVQNWIQGLHGAELEAFDPQIFTEISPLLDSPEGVRLPADQTPAE